MVDLSNAQAGRAALGLTLLEHEGALAALLDQRLEAVACTSAILRLFGLESEAEKHLLSARLPATWAQACQGALQGDARELEHATLEHRVLGKREICAKVHPWRASPGAAIGGVVLICQDDTELKRRDSEVELAHEILSVATRTAKCGAWRFDFESKSVWSTPEYFEIMGQRLTYKELTARKPIWIAEEDLPAYRAFIEELRGPAGRASVEHRLADAPKTWIHASCENIFAADGSVRAVVGMARNITDRKNAELELVDAIQGASRQLRAKREMLDEICNELGVADDSESHEEPSDAPSEDSGVAELTKHFLRMVKELAAHDKMLSAAVQELRISRAMVQQSSLAKTQFLATMTHELRTPLNAIIGYTELVLEDTLERQDEAAGADMKRVLIAAKNLLIMVNAILDLTKIDAGDTKLEAEPYDPAALALEVAEDLEGAAAANGNSLHVHHQDLGEAVGDGAKLRQCLANLLSNACKFTHGGAVTLNARREPGTNGDWLKFEIVDTGIGIEEGHLARLFEPFTQADASKTRAYEGAGVGLAIARGVARLMGGDISVQSVLGQGSTFTLRVPAHQARSGRLGAAA